MATLQVALDLLELDRAIKIAQEAVDGGVDWIEVGTPLIKSEGMNSVRQLKKRFPNKTIIADMKTMDVGSIEVEMAAKSGADIICVLAAADLSTIREAIESAKRYGSKIMVDMINIENPMEKIKKLKSLSIDYICLHTGVDAQMRGNEIGEIEEIIKNSNTEIAVAGGINSETALQYTKLGADIIIVGGAITKSPNIKKATQDIKKALQGTQIKTQKYKKQVENISEIFQKVSCANISDAMHRTGVMKGIKNISGKKMVGRAITVRTMNGDWAKSVEAIDIAKKGDVIVIDADGGDSALWGALASRSCIVKGINGVVINGSVRDIEEIKKMGFPAFAKNITPNAGDPKGFGEINIELKCCDVTIKPGDWIVGDVDGVVVIPMEKGIEIANRAMDVKEKEERLEQEIKQNSTLSKVLNLKKWEKIR